MLKRNIKYLFVLLQVFSLNCMQREQTIDLESIELRNLSLETAANLYCIANLLIYQKSTLYLIESLSGIIEDLVENSNEEPKFLSYCFAHRPGNEGLDIHKEILDIEKGKNASTWKVESFSIDNNSDLESFKNINIDKDTVLIKSIESILLFFKLNRNFSNNNKHIIENYYNKYNFLLKLKNQADRDLSSLIRNELNKVEKDIIFYKLDENLIISLKALMQITDEVKSQTNLKGTYVFGSEGFIKSDFIQNFIEWLKKNNLHNFILKYNPELIGFIKKIGILSKFVQNLKDRETISNRGTIISKSEAIFIKKIFEKILEDKESFIEKSGELYLKIKKIKWRNRSKSCLNDYYFNYISLPVQSELNKMDSLKRSFLPSELSENDGEFKKYLENFLGTNISFKIKEEDEGWLDFLNKNNSKKIVPKKGKTKKSRRRPSRKDYKNEEELQENINLNPVKTEDQNKYKNINLPFYHDRILKWFDPEFQVDKSRFSILYHTYCPIVDLIIKQHGKCKFRDSSNGEIAYFQEGAIRFGEEKFIPAVFVNCYNKYGYCYHRGIETKKNQEIFKEISENNIIFNFPYEESIEKDLKTYKFNLPDDYNIYDIKEFKENSLCVYINDIKNNVTLVLLK